MEATDQNATIDSPTSDGSPQLLNNSSRRAQSPECSKCVNRKANASRAYAAARNSQESVSRYREVHNENGQLIKINIEQRGYIEQLTQKIQALEREKSEILVFQKNDQRLYKELCERHKVAQDVIKHAQQQNSEYKDIKKRHDDMKIALNEVNQKRLALISKYKNSVELLQKENMQKRTAQKRVDEQTDQLKMAHKALTAASTLMRSVKTLLVELESTKKSKATEVKIKNVKSKIENFEAFREAEKHPNRITDEITAALLTASLELEEEDKSEAAQGASESVTEFDQPPRKKPRVSRTSRQSVESVQSSGSTRFDEFESPPNDLVPLSELDNNDTAENHSKDPLFSLGLDDLESEETPAATEAEASVPARNAHVAKPQRNAQHTFKLPNVPQSVSPARKSRAATKAGGAQRKYDLSKYIDSSPEPPERTPSPKRTRSNQRINNSSSRIKVPVLEQPKRERRRTLMSMDQSPLKTTKSSKVQSPAKRAVQHKPIAPTTEVSIQNAEEKQKLQEPREEPTKKPEKVEKRKKEMCEDMPDVDDVIARMEEKANQKREDRHRMLNQQRVGRRSTITSPTQRVPSVVPVDGGSHALPQRPMEAERPIALKPVVNHAQETLEDKDTMKEAPTEATPEEPRVLLKTTEKPRTVEVKPKSPAKSDEASDAEVKSMQPTPVSPVKPVAAPPSNEVRSSSDGESVSETDKSEPPKIATGEPEEPFKTESLPESSEPTGVKTKETPCASSENVSEAEIATAVEPQTPAEDRLESVSRTALPSPVKVAQLPKKVPTRVAEPELPRPRRIVLDLSDDAESTTEVVAVKPVPFSRKPKAKEDEEPLTAKPKPAESPACAIQESSKEPREDERNERRSVPPQEKPIP
ncbi:hypothetical protein L596_004978 [Steinernema carpocapsae]|uniref:Uncharacterized protein n=1 Tax=Steinernema carpocapsae TaxID=34508 RepID=A0A4U8UZ07_STECR|nr:hypothetical protein L596_004978 [Steinernema carpocapsae]